MAVSLLILSILVTSVLSQSCNIRETDEGSVCVCNAKYCDTVPDLDVSTGKYQVYSTSKAKLGFYSTTGSFVENTDGEESSIIIDQDTKHQSIIGFGGAFTDSTGINIKLLPEGAQKNLIESYFGSSGIAYSLCRVPIGGTDFSTRGYSYDDVEGDDTLEHFALQDDDFDFKIPFILQAKALRNDNIKLFASAWSAPTWMKTNNDWSGIGSLKEEYYQLWADYILRFYEEYEKQNISFWGVTTQNEPSDGLTVSTKINSMGWSSSQMNKWVGENLGPTIRNSTFSDLKIMLHDDSRNTFSNLSLLLQNEKTMSYADGVAVHWYANTEIPASSLEILNIVRTLFDKEDWFFISSEACNGYLYVFGMDKSVRKGSWSRGENYINDILDNLEHGAVGWVDWNMVLNEIGGPTYIDNYLDSPVLINATMQEFYKQPMFYSLGHFSKFAVPDSIRLETTVEELDNVRAMAFLRPDNLIALIISNSGSEKTSVRIQNSQGQTAAIQIEANSINTVLYS
ncbi:putative glucosylceramidase 3 [Anoplophora glabripennis]|uniref:putative glucosylceramidase 3 n=1 Tax=Anoplophora glabripennis TaxID=217634 RepID=UPI000C77369D|nr:putative glucosylceramidase 3 [Anoplophora glabripennis]